MTDQTVVEFVDSLQKLHLPRSYEVHCPLLARNADPKIQCPNDCPGKMMADQIPGKTYPRSAQCVVVGFRRLMTKWGRAQEAIDFDRYGPEGGSE